MKTAQTAATSDGLRRKKAPLRSVRRTN